MRGLLLGAAALAAVASGCGAPRASAEAERSAPPEPQVDLAGFDVVVIAHRGETIDIERHRVAGKVTVFDFYADWCKPCQYVDAWMLTQLEKHDDIAVRKINVVDWDSPVAERYLADRIPELPYLVVYSPSGEWQGEVWGGRISKLKRLIEGARGEKDDG